MIRKSGGLAYPLFRLQTRLFDYWSPLCHLRLKELCTLLWRGANRHIGHCRKLRLHVGLREARDDDVVKPRNNIFGRAGGCYEGGPCYALDLRKSCFSHGRYFQQCRRSLLSCHRQRSQLTGFDQRHCRRHGAERDRRMAADRRLHSRATAIEWHVHEVEEQRMLEQRVGAGCLRRAKRSSPCLDWRESMRLAL